MSNLSTRAGRRKAGAVENPPTVEELGMGSYPPVEIARESQLGPPVLVPPRLLAESRDPAVRIFLYLDSRAAYWSEARGRPVVGVWETPGTIAAATGLPESTVRHHVLPRMEAERHVRRQEVVVDGHVRTIVWCLWLFPDPLAGVEIHLDGALVPVGPPAARRPAPRAPRPAPAVAARAPVAAPKGSKELKELKTEEKTTDRRPEVVVVEASPGSGEEIGDTPPAPLPTEVEEKIVKEIDPGGVPAIRAAAAGWVRDHPAEFVAEAIELGAAAERDPDRRKDPKRRVMSLPRFIAKTLDNWKREGRVKARPAPGGAAARAGAEARAAAEKRAKAQAEREACSHELALKEFWDSLPWPEQEKVRTKVKADNPDLARLKGMLGPLCLAAIAPRLPAMAGGAP